MAVTDDTLQERLEEVFEDTDLSIHEQNGEVTVEVQQEDYFQFCLKLRDHAKFCCRQLIDLCAVDYAEYQGKEKPKSRFAAVSHLLSYQLNERIRVRVWADQDEFPVIPSVVPIWKSADWFEREAFDLYGVVFEGHPDLRRILTDYGFIGHPLRKDFPMVGHVEMCYDETKKRVVYEPVSIEERMNIQRVIHEDNRYMEQQNG